MGSCQVAKLQAANCTPSLVPRRRHLVCVLFIEKHRTIEMRQVDRAWHGMVTWCMVWSPGARLNLIAYLIFVIGTVSVPVSKNPKLMLKMSITGLYTPPTAIQPSQLMKFSKNIRSYWPAEAP